MAFVAFKMRTRGRATSVAQGSRAGVEPSRSSRRREAVPERNRLFHTDPQTDRWHPQACAESSVPGGTGLESRSTVMANIVSGALWSDSMSDSQPNARGRRPVLRSGATHGRLP